jgi:glyoxylase-like metal-dependent hydrolase (beta-lactamase superfamily II)
MPASDAQASPLGFDRWEHGLPRRGSTPAAPIHVQAFGEDTWVLRQAKLVCYEAPFMYLLRGSDRSLLVDTGAVSDARRFPLRLTVDEIIGKDGPLLVVHTHGHGDHVAADRQFSDRANTVLVNRDLPSVYEFFGWSSPTSQGPGATTLTDVGSLKASIELGDRRIDVIPTPGHHATSISFSDSLTRWLLSGDTVYPGRLYVQDYPAFRVSLDRLVELAESNRASYVLGCHVEMTSVPGRDYPIGCTYQPDEPPLEMSVEQLVAVREASRSIVVPGIYPSDDFIIYNGTGLGVAWRPACRGLAHRTRELLFGH